MRALAFGTYDRAYPRNAQVISALRGAGVDVTELNRSVWHHRSNWSLGTRQATRLLKAEASLLASRRVDADVVLVGYPGHFDLPAARRAAHGRPIVFNPLVSLHDTLVRDRGRFGPRSPVARLLAAVDRAAFRGADLVVADTASHAAFFRERFGLAAHQVGVCLVGAEDRLFTPAAAAVAAPFHVLFVGKLIPLHGIDVVLEAARLVPEIPFRVVGTGQLAGVMARRPGNVTWDEWLEPARLPDAYRSAGCALGIFAATPKAARVIPNKAFQAIACARPLVTADTPAARELLTDGVDALLVPPGDPAALAEAVARLAGDGVLRERLSAGGRATYEARASEPVLGMQWRALLERAVGAR